MEFPLAEARQYLWEKERSPEPNWMVVNEPTEICTSQHRRNKISDFEMGCVESESPAMLRIAEDGVW
jgi:hypothetical protein